MLQLVDMGKYLVAFRLALARELMYRANFVFGRLRALVLYIALLFVFHMFGRESIIYSQEELSTYIVLAGSMYMMLFVYSMDMVASEIVDGDLINFLLRPINYLAYWFWKIGAMRVLNILAAIVSLVLVVAATRSSFFFQTHIFSLMQFAVLLIGALSIITLIDFIAGSLSFWTYRSHGPRWLSMIGIQFLSGAYAPLDLFPGWLQQIYGATPFPSIVFVPITAYLGRMNGYEFLAALLVQGVWIGVLGVVLAVVWKKGIRSYEAVGR
ncbi:MAG: ABC-2 family transporter protein [Patescibacteria group bacterium]